MKTLKLFIAAMLTVIGILCLSQPASAQNLSKEQRDMVVAELRKHLPMEAAEGITWTKISFNSEGTIMYLAFKVDLKKIASEDDELTEESAMEIFNSFSDAEFKEYLGEEFASMMETFGCDVEITLAFPNGTIKKFKLKN